MRTKSVLIAWILVAACDRSVSAPVAVSASASVPNSDSGSVSVPVSDSGAVFAQIDPDGDDDPADTGRGTRPTSGQFARVGRTWLSLSRICDLTVFDGALYAAHAYQPLGIDGATITKYERLEDHTNKFSVAFDWNRPGEPTGGGGAGQGFIRVHSFLNKLWVADADPPYDGFGILDQGTEGYVFVSDEHGEFAKAINPTKDEERPRKAHYRPPKTAIVIPRAYHDLDVVHFRGKVWASTGSVPPNEHAWHGSSPGALNVYDEEKKRFAYVVGYPDNATSDVWRLTYMVRYRDKLYAGIQEYYPREPNDFVVFDGDKLEPRRVTDDGGAETLRWYADSGSLYWITIDKDGSGRLRVTHDAKTWTTIDFPPNVGRPTDVTRFRDGLVVLTERALFKLDGETLTPIASWPDTGATKKLFAADDFFCAAPLAVYKNDLYAGSQKDGALYKLE